MIFVVYLGFLATLCSAVSPCAQNFHPDNSTPTVCYSLNDTAVSWEEAQKTCNQLSPPANLLKFNTDNETDNFFKLYHSLYNANYPVRWVGLKRNCGSPSNKSSFEWIDGTSTANLHQFPFLGTVDNYNYLDGAEETCYVSSGDVEYGGDNNCNDKKPFICQYRIIENNTVIPVDVPYCPFPSTGDVCPTGWARHSLAPKLCFKFFEIHTTNWAEAAQLCQNLGDNITLPILRNENEQMALMNLTSECIHSKDGSGTETWLGLTYNSKFTWMDKTGYGYNNDMKIGAIDHQCGITSNTSSNMIWKTVPCNSSNGGPIQFGRVTCQRRLSRGNLVIPPTIPVNSTCSLSALSDPPINCAVNPPYSSLTSNDDNSLLYDKDDRVYTLHSWATNWTSAMDFCNKLGSYLARPQKMSELTQLLNFTSNAPFWIGARLNVGDGLAYFYSTKNNKSSRMNWWPNGNSFFNPTNQTGANLNQPCYYYDDPSKLKFDNCNVAKGFVCEKIKSTLGGCPVSPATIPNGNTLTSCDGGQTVYYTCDSDYYIVDNNPRVCNKNGTQNNWLTKVPDCYKYCKNDTLLFDSNTSYVSFDTPTGLLDIYSTGTLHCKDGLWPVPANQSTVSHCSPNGTWENLPNCSVRCNLTNITNANAIYSNYGEIGSIGTFHCNPGFYIVGPDTLICNANYSWNGSFPLCQNYCYSINCNNGTCVVDDHGYHCKCSDGYFGKNCTRVNQCILGSIQNAGKRRKRLTELIAGDNSIVNLTEILDDVHDTYNIPTAAVENLLSATLKPNVFGGKLNQLKTLLNGLPLTSSNGNDPCAPNGICVSGQDFAACICDDMYFGKFCKEINCSTIPWSPWSECEASCTTKTGTRRRTHNGHNDCQYEYESCTKTNCDPLSPPSRLIATISQSLGCSLVLLSLGLLLGLFAFFRIMSLERMLHMGQEISLFVGYSAILITIQFDLSKTTCSIIAILLQYSFLANYTFIALEALQTFCILQNVLSKGGFFSWQTNLAIGISAPLAITAITALTSFNDLPSEYSCWLNIGHHVSLATVIPLLFAGTVVAVLSEAAAMGEIRKLPLINNNKYTAALVSQKGLVSVIILNIFSWMLGTWTLYKQDLALYIFDFTINVTFAVVIFIAHVFSNDRVVGFLRRIFCHRKSTAKGNNFELERFHNNVN